MKYFHEKRYALMHLVIGCVLIIVAMIIKVQTPLTRFVEDQYALKPGKYLFKLWQKIPVEVMVGVYVFNVTNSKEFLSGQDKKLQFDQIGPYIYQEITEHRNPIFNPNGTITFEIHREVIDRTAEFTANPNKDIVYTPNLLLLGISTVAAKHAKVAAYGFTALTKHLNAKPILNMTVQDLLWGYEDEMISLATRFFPSLLPSKKFGFMDKMFDEGKNIVTMHLPESIEILRKQRDEKKREQMEEEKLSKSSINIDFEYEEDYDVNFESEKDHNKIEEIVEPLPRQYEVDLWNGSPLLPFFGNVKNQFPTCNKVQGACDGSMYPKNVSKLAKFKAYRKGFCRVLPLYFARDGQHMGIDAYWFELSENVFHDDPNDPVTSCFCETEKTCLKRGLGNVAQCKFGLPMALSQPHFFNADPSLANEVIGMNPDSKKHQSYIIIQPNLGFAMDGCLRVQLNLITGDLSFNEEIKQFSNLVIPFMWVDVSIDELPWNVKLVLQLAFKILPALQTIIFIILIIYGVFLKAKGVKLIFKAKTVEKVNQSEILPLKDHNQRKEKN